MSTINFLTPGFNKAGQNNLDNQGGLIGPENDPVINDLVTIFTSPGTFNRTKTEGTVLVVAGGGGAANRSGGGGAGGADDSSGAGGAAVEVSELHFHQPHPRLNMRHV